MPHNTEPQNDLVNHIMNDFADHESRLRAIIAYARSEGSEPKERYTQAIEAAYADLINKAKVEARMVELDLFEQFLNRHNNKGITRSDLYNFKMERLKDLQGRLESQIKEGS